MEDVTGEVYFMIIFIHYVIGMCVVYYGGI